MKQILPVLLALTLSACAIDGQGPPLFQAGAATIDITPDHPVPLGGYGARNGRLMSGVHDPIHAKALWLETPDQRVCILTVDLIGSLDSLRQATLARIPADLGLEGNLILVASHTHSGPGGLIKDNPLVRTAMGEFDEALYRRYSELFAEAVCRAAATRKPASIAVVTGEEKGRSRNRRDEYYPPGKAPIDPELLLLEVRGTDDHPIALLVNFAAHPTILGPGNMEVSADWPGALQRSLEEKLPGTVVLFTNGAEGDLAPDTPPGEGDFDRMEKMGTALADRVLEIRRQIANPAPQVTMRYEERAVDLPKPKNRFVPKRSVLGALRLNDAIFLCVPGEMGVEIGLHLKNELRGKMGFRSAAVLGLANDHLGYFLTKSQYRKGGYEFMISFYGADMADFLTDHLLRLATETRNP